MFGLLGAVLLAFAHSSAPLAITGYILLSVFVVLFAVGIVRFGSAIRSKRIFKSSMGG
jgi:hypothetical protein